MQLESYRHRQTGTVAWWALAGGLALEAIVFWAVSLAAPPEVDRVFVWALGGSAALFLLIGWLFGSLRVALTGEAVEVAFGPGWPRKEIPFSEISAARPVRNSWWWGWGIRLTPHGWLWNVSGLDAVEIELTSGKRFRIGTDEPERLAEAVRSALG